jgi:hypothetical protein
LPLPDRCRVLAALSSDLMTMNPQFFRSSAFAWCFSLPYLLFVPLTHSSLCLDCAAEHHRAYSSATQGQAKQRKAHHLSCLPSIHREPCTISRANPYHATSIVVAPGLWLRGLLLPPPRRLRLLNITADTQVGRSITRPEVTGHEDTTYLPCLGTCG